jgi:hypothetical protein
VLDLPKLQKKRRSGEAYRDTCTEWQKAFALGSTG